MTTDTGLAGPNQPAERSNAAQPRCVHCGALLAAGISWCAQCYTSIVPPPVGKPAAATEPGAATRPHAISEPEVRAQPDDLGPRVAAAWSGDPAADVDVPERRQLVEGDVDPRVTAEADRMLALLGSTASSASGHGRSPLASLTSAMSNTGVRVGVIVAGTVVLSMVGFALMSLLGHML